MKYATLIYLIFTLGVLSTACRTNKTASVSTSITTDSLISVHLREIVRQSIIKEQQNDSVAIKRVVVVKDSVVLTADTSGNVIKSERFRSTDSATDRARISNRESDRQSNEESKDSVADSHNSMVNADNETTITPSERELGWWERTTNAIGDVLTIATVLIVIAGFLWLIKRKK
ncbi:MAG: hypothetical protein K2M69_08345 [Muribaculaceae bacterium]|nr:hypothetical protein [Muribaculaceae bacterium]